MNGFVILLSMIFGTALIIGSVQYVAADHLEPGRGIFADEGVAYIIETKGSPYQVYLQSVIRNGDGQLINVTESTAVGAYVPHEITDHTFDTFMGKKDIVTIGNIKYETKPEEMKEVTFYTGINIFMSRNITRTFIE